MEPLKRPAPTLANNCEAHQTESTVLLPRLTRIYEQNQALVAMLEFMATTSQQPKASNEIIYCWDLASSRIEVMQDQTLSICFMPILLPDDHPQAGRPCIVLHPEAQQHITGSDGSKTTQSALFCAFAVHRALRDQLQQEKRGDIEENLELQLLVVTNFISNVWMPELEKAFSSTQTDNRMKIRYWRICRLTLALDQKLHLVCNAGIFRGKIVSAVYDLNLEHVLLQGLGGSGTSLSRGFL